MIFEKTFAFTIKQSRHIYTKVSNTRLDIFRAMSRLRSWRKHAIVDKRKK